MLVIDDRTLLLVLADRAPNELQRSATASEVYTTPGWYYRLARAVHDEAFTGSLSRVFEGLPRDVRERVTGALDQLPAEIGILSARVLVPVMVQLGDVGHLNLLNAEAVASALIVDGRLRVTVAAERLGSACSAVGVDLDVVPI